MAAGFDEFDDESGGSEGSKLRQKLEQTLEINRKQTEELRALKVKDVIREKGYTSVKPEDLESVDLDEVEAAAERIENERASFREQTIRDFLEAQGFEGDDLEDAIEQFGGSAAAESAEAQGRARARSVGQLESRPVPKVNPDNLHGTDAMAAAFSQSEKRQRRRT